jgi:hypothetical protein
MRDQYAADVSDLLKFAFLRTLAADDRSLGVGWYYNPANDGRPDGRHREYLAEAKWNTLDAPLFAALVSLPQPPSVHGLEKLPIWPSATCFHRVPVPISGSREAWAVSMLSALDQASIVFLDPDNGVGAVSQRHATVAEIASLRKPGRTIVLIKFPGRDKTHAEQVEKYHSAIRSGAGALSTVTVRTNVFVRASELAHWVPRARWFTLVDADDQLIERAAQFAARLNRIDKCSAHVVHGPEIIAMSNEKPLGAVLRLMGLLERALRALTPDQSTPFHKQVDAHRSYFSDISGITDARRVRNAIAHGEDVSVARSVEAEAVLRQALMEIAPKCPERLRTALREEQALPSTTTSNIQAPALMGTAAPLPAIQSRIAQPPRITGGGVKVPNICPECGHQFKGNGFDGIDAHWRARHEIVMPYRQAWPLIRSGEYHRPSK